MPRSEVRAALDELEHDVVTVPLAPAAILARGRARHLRASAAVAVVALA